MRGGNRANKRKRERREGVSGIEGQRHRERRHRRSSDVSSGGAAAASTSARRRAPSAPSGRRPPRSSTPRASAPAPMTAVTVPPATCSRAGTMSGEARPGQLGPGNKLCGQGRAGPENSVDGPGEVETGGTIWEFPDEQIKCPSRWSPGPAQPERGIAPGGWGGWRGAAAARERDGTEEGGPGWEASEERGDHGR